MYYRAFKTFIYNVPIDRAIFIMNNIGVMCYNEMFMAYH